MGALSVAGRALVLTSADESFAPLFSDEWLGTELWPAAMVLTAHLERQCEALDLARSSVVELGAGTGACGLAAALLGSRDVLLTDKASLLPALERNAHANGVCPASVRCATLDWHRVATAGLEDALPRGADLVLMSDCLNPVYGPDHASGLARTLRAILSRRIESRAACAPETASAHASEPFGLLAQTRRGRCEAEATFFAECEQCGVRATLVETVEMAGGRSKHDDGDRCGGSSPMEDQAARGIGEGDGTSAVAAVVGLYKLVLSSST